MISLVLSFVFLVAGDFFILSFVWSICRDSNTLLSFPVDDSIIEIWEAALLRISGLWIFLLLMWFLLLMRELSFLTYSWAMCFLLRSGSLLSWTFLFTVPVTSWLFPTELKKLSPLGFSPKLSLLSTILLPSCSSELSLMDALECFFLPLSIVGYGPDGCSGGALPVSFLGIYSLACDICFLILW